MIQVIYRLRPGTSGDGGMSVVPKQLLPWWKNDIGSYRKIIKQIAVHGMQIPCTAVYL